MLQVSGEPRKEGSPQCKRWKLKAAYATIAHRMIRRIAGRIRRALLARAASLRGPVRNPFPLPLGPTIAVISGELAAAAKRRFVASFRRDRRLRIGLDIHSLILESANSLRWTPGRRQRGVWLRFRVTGRFLFGA